MPVASRWLIPRAITLGIIYFLLASLTVGTTRLGGGVAVLFFANAILIAYLLTTKRRDWRAALTACGLASAAATSLFGLGLSAAPMFAVVNMLEAAIAAALFRRMSGHSSPLESMRGFFTFVLCAAIIAPALTAVCGAAIATFYNVGFVENMVRWFTGHGLGTLTFAPASLLILRGDIGQWLRSSSKRLVAEAVILLALVALTTLFVFLQEGLPLLFLPWLPVIAATFRLGRLGAAASIGIVATVAGAATLLGTGAIAALVEPREAELQFLQFYLAATVMAVLPAAAELAQRKGLFERLQSSERRYRLLADHSTDIILDIDLDGKIAFASAAIRQIGGYSPEEVIGRPATDLIDPEDIEKVRIGHARAIATPGIVETFEYRGIKADGSQIWLETRTQGVFDEKGRVLGAVSAIRNVEARRAREHVLATEARTDGLTGALNRRAFMRELDQAAAAKRRSERGCLALFDLDHFKRINDTLGHAAGDQVLIDFVKLARRIVREDDLVGRIGGEEFAILLRGASFEQARHVCERLRLACAAEIDSSGLPDDITVSIGIADFDGAIASEVMARADAALYRAKRAGRNRLELAA